MIVIRGEELIFLYPDGEELHAINNEDEENAWYYKCCVDISDRFKEGMDIAVVGAGLMKLQKVLGHYHWGGMDTYELYPEMIEHNNGSDWNMILGDYHVMDKVYDVIVFDADVEPDREFLLSRLKPDGKIYVWSWGIDAESGTPTEW